MAKVGLPCVQNVCGVCCCCCSTDNGQITARVAADRLTIFLPLPAFSAFICTIYTWQLSYNIHVTAIIQYTVVHVTAIIQYTCDSYYTLYTWQLLYNLHVTAIIQYTRDSYYTIYTWQLLYYTIYTWQLLPGIITFFRWQMSSQNIDATAIFIQNEQLCHTPNAPFIIPCYRVKN